MAEVIRIVEVSISDEEINQVVEVLKSGMLADGEQVREFERRFADYCGVKYGIATSSGTTALHTSLAALEVKPGEKVLTTPFTFIATGNSILHCGGAPEFADIDYHTFNIAPAEIERKLREIPEIRIMIIVHLFGQPCDMDAITEIARRHNVKVVEDCAQAHGAEYDGRKVGSFGDISIFSFYPTKNMTTGEGGIITTNDEELADKCRKIVNHGRSGRYEHDILGYNYRMTNIAAAIGLGQLERLDECNQRRIENAAFLSENLSKLDWLEPPVVGNNCKHVFHLYTVKVSKRDEFANYLQENGIQTSVVYPRPLYRQPLYERLGYQANCSNTEKVCDRVLSIPVQPALTRDDLQKIVDVICKFKEN